MKRNRKTPIERALLMGVAGLTLAGCGLHVGRVDLNAHVTPGLYHQIALRDDGRAEVLAKLGPPDRVFFFPDEEVLEYESEHHRATDFRIILPLALIPGPGAGLILGALRYFIDPFEEPDETDQELPVQITRVLVNGLVGMAPSANSEDLLILRGRQLRSDVIRVVVDRQSRRVAQKSLRLASGEYQEDSIVERALLQTD